MGVDGSVGSAAAFRWAVEEARRWDATIEAVHAWQFPYVGEVSTMAASSMGYESLEEEARATLNESIEQARLLAPEVRVEPVLAHGGATTALLERAEGADLLVVGSRGLGSFAALLLGSVSQQCAHHTPCPLVIVPFPS